MSYEQQIDETYARDEDLDISKPINEIDAEEYHFQEPKPKAIIYFTFIIGFLILTVISVVFSILFGTNLIQNNIRDATPDLAKPFLVPMEAVLTAFTGGFLGLFVMTFLILSVVRAKCGVDEEKGGRMYQISLDIAIGARQFLIREFKVLAIFIVVVFAALFATDYSGYYIPTPACFLVGALTSGLTSVIGMGIATAANVRTANAARRSLNEALRVAFNAGTVMGLSVVSLGVLMIAVMYLVFRNLSALAGFGFGASSIALFARVGGGIFTKAADVGADLVGKVEANIPEDDPRNPAVIADNVGDNVGDVAGMGADLFESYVGSVIAAMTLGAEFFGSKGVAAPLYLSAGGILCSIIGSALVTTKEDTSGDIQGRLLWAIRKGIYSASGLNILLGALVIFLMFDPVKQGWALFLCFVIGSIAGVLIGITTEYYTSFSYRPTQSIAESGMTGPAPVIISGLSIGMQSTVLPILIIVVSIILTVILGDIAGGEEQRAGVYGISIAAVGMLSTLGVTLATDAYGPVADNAGGIAEMSNLPDEVRERTDALDALGNTTAATGKGFAIGSAVLTALALLHAFARAGGLSEINLLDANVLSGIIIGACLPYIFAALTMSAVGSAAMQIIVEVRRQFQEIPGLLEGRPGARADHARCVDYCTKSALKKMVVPGILTVSAPVLVGFIGRQKMLGGLLAGAIASGCLLAITMANAGGAWDNAKKYVEAGMLVDKETGETQKKGSEAHKACVVGDTLGDPFKDTSGPSLNILIKLMTIISLVIAPGLKYLFGTA
jgi:K(+)-stimulated pyrophosphate-energized sodium pump